MGIDDNILIFRMIGDLKSVVALLKKGADYVAKLPERSSPLSVLTLAEKGFFSLILFISCLFRNCVNERGRESLRV
tara:strand:- start:1033 stop:1260 length:228 start_codon:yes stop_codon:yes gene_type:complete